MLLTAVRFKTRILSFVNIRVSTRYQMVLDLGPGCCGMLTQGVKLLTHAGFKTRILSSVGIKVVTCY